MFICNINEGIVGLLIGPRGSGKSYNLIQLLINKQLYRGKFDKVFIFSPSFYVDRKFSILGIDSKQVFTEYKPKEIEKLYKNHNPSKDGHYLVILDDCITADDFKSNNSNNILNTIAVNGRNKQFSMFITSQKVTGISSYIRSQSDFVILYPPRGLNEMKAFYEDNVIGNYTYKEFVELIGSLKRYEFLAINYQNYKVFKNYKSLAKRT